MTGMTGWIIATVVSLVLTGAVWTNGLLVGEKQTQWRYLTQLQIEYAELNRTYELCKHRRVCR